jgi:hypothetical protein
VSLSSLSLFLLSFFSLHSQRKAQANATKRSKFQKGRAQAAALAARQEVAEENKTKELKFKYKYVGWMQKDAEAVRLAANH